MKLICLDIEATERREMLELSIINFIDKKELYHSYFKPVFSTKWKLEPHNITPEMVKRAPYVRDEKQKIQNIIDESDGIIGFAFNNDLKYLRANNIYFREDKDLIEVQNWFWLYIGKELGIEMGNVPKLSKCAELCNLDFSEETDAHSASNDALITINIFNYILQSISLIGVNKNALDVFNNLFKIEEEKYLQEKARGILLLEEVKDGYQLKNYSMNKIVESNYLIRVKSRYIAEHEIREKFKPRETSPNSGIYKLEKKDFIFFMEYTNDYDSTKEALYKHIYNAKKSHKNKFKFRFKL